ncbi:hypothetical protein SAMN05428981_107165 [Bacillus sp. OV194]|nr:hypothetical protein SAMN05428981_107165 [Bacillus sp. OV194]
MEVPEEVDMVTYEQTEVVPRSCNSRPQGFFDLGGGSFFISRRKMKNNETEEYCYESDINGSSNSIRN